MIKFILNGYFRSGTTLLWKIMRDSNPDMYVFCEPLHNDLFNAMHREQVLNQYGHGYSTTSEYIALGEEFLTRVRQSHPLLGTDVYTYKVDEVVKYLNIYDSLDKPVILQPDRMHFLLSDIADVFDCKVAHIIRHPLEVFLSVMFSSPKLKTVRKLTGIDPCFLRLLHNSNPFFLEEQYDFICRYFGLLQTLNTPYGKYIYPKRYYLERFIICWTISNWYAVNEIDKANGLIVRYEDIVSRSEDTFQTLEEYSGVKFNPMNAKINTNSIKKYKNSDVSRCLFLAEKVGVLEKYRYLMERFGL